MYNLCKSRHLKQPQLLIIRKPSTHETNLVQCLKEFLDVYFVTRRRGDFSYADNNKVLWFIDELRGLVSDRCTYVEYVIRQECTLDRKYDRPFVKEKNVPIMMLSNT